MWRSQTCMKPLAWANPGSLTLRCKHLLPGHSAACEIHHIGEPHLFQHHACLHAPAACLAMHYNLLVFEILQVFQLHAQNPAQRKEYAAYIVFSIFRWLTDIYYG